MHVNISSAKWRSIRSGDTRRVHKTHIDSSVVNGYPQHGPRTRYVKLQVAHVPGRPGTLIFRFLYVHSWFLLWAIMLFLISYTFKTWIYWLTYLGCLTWNFCIPLQTWDELLHMHYWCVFLLRPALFFENQMELFSIIPLTIYTSHDINVPITLNDVVR